MSLRLLLRKPRLKHQPEVHSCNFCFVFKYETTASELILPSAGRAACDQEFPRWRQTASLWVALLFGILLTERGRPHDRVIEWQMVPSSPSFRLLVDRQQKAPNTLCWTQKIHTAWWMVARVAFRKQERNTFVLAPSLVTVHKTAVFLLCSFQSWVSVPCAEEVQEASLCWCTRRLQRFAGPESRFCKKTFCSTHLKVEKNSIMSF